MTQFTLNLIKGSSRPIVKLKEFHNLKALLDNCEINIRNLRIEDRNGHLHILCNSEKYE